MKILKATIIAIYFLIIMDTDDSLRLDYHMDLLLHDLISGEMSGVLPKEVLNRLNIYVKPEAIPELRNLKLLKLVNHNAYFKGIENYLQFIIDHNTEVQYALQFIEEEISGIQYELAKIEDDLNPEDKSIMESYISSLKCMIKILPNIKSKESLPPIDTSEIELNKEIAKLLAPIVGSKLGNSDIIEKLNEMDKKIKQAKSPCDIFSIEYISQYVIKNAKHIQTKLKKIHNWLKMIPWKQKRRLEMMLNSRNVPWKSYYNNYSSFQNLLGNLAEFYNINFSFRIYWENMSTKINNNFINFIKINSIMEAETEEFKHNATGFRYNNLIKPKTNLTKEANKMKDYEIQVLHAINYGSEDEIETLWNNEMRKNLNERILIEFTKIKEYLQEQQLLRKYIEEQIKPKETKPK